MEITTTTGTGDLGYVSLNVPCVGYIVEYTEKSYVILNVTIYLEESGMSGTATILRVNDDSEDMGEESVIVDISALSVI